MAAAVPYIAVIGGSYVGVNVAQQLAAQFFGRFRVLLIEKNSHFQHLFAFPRFAVWQDLDTHKAFIPYTPGTFASCPPDSGTVVQAIATKINGSTIQLDRNVTLDGATVNSIPYAYLVITTGTKLTPPSTLPGSEKTDGVTYLRTHAKKVSESKKIAIIGAGAVGVQMATDIAELYPGKQVTLIHSRDRVMNKFHPELDKIIKARAEELGIRLKLGSRVKLPAQGFPTDGRVFDVELVDGSSVSADLAIIATGQTPQSEIVKTFSPNSIDGSGFVRVLDTLQISDPDFPNVFALGDVAATAAHKAARPAGAQATLVVKNIEHSLSNEELEKYVVLDPPAIHMSLGLKKNIVFRNPAKGATEPTMVHRDDGSLDMNIDGVWKKRGGGANAYL